MKKGIVLGLAAAMLVPTVCGAAEHKAVYNSEAKNVYIEGKLDNYSGGKLTLKLYRGDEIGYINEISPEKNGAYVFKFKTNADISNLTYDLKLDGENVNNSVIDAYSDKASLISADIYLSDGNGGGLRIDGDTSRMTYSDTDFQTYPTEDQSQTHKYEVTNLEDYIKPDTEVGVFVYPKNELGNENTGYTVMLAQYGENNTLLGFKTLATKEMTYFDYSGKAVDCGKTALSTGVKSVKAFIWDKESKLVPYANAADGKLKPTNVYLVGDSTSQRWDFDWMSVFPQAGIGSFLGDYFNPDYVTFKNVSVSGASTTTFLDDEPGLGNWDDLMSKVQKGDYAIINLGINDLCANWGAEKKAEFKSNIETMVKDLIEKGVTPVLGSPVLETGGDSVNNGVKYADVALEALEEVGKEYNVTVLPIHKTAQSKYKEMGLTTSQAADKYHLTADGVKAIIGEENYAKYYVKGKNSAFEGDPNHFDLTADTGHLNVYGADFYANIIAELIEKTDCTLKFYHK